MSTVFVITPIIGWEMKYKDLFKGVEKYIPPITHLEDRYDPENGRKLKPEVVVDQDSKILIILNGKTFDLEESGDTIQDICNKILKQSSLIVNEETNQIWISIKLSHSKKEADYGNVMVLGPYKLPENLDQAIQNTLDEIFLIFNMKLDKSKVRLIGTTEIC